MTARRTKAVSGEGRAAIRYRIVPADPKAHLFEVTCTVDRPDPDGQVLALPAWIPGSYMIREFARNIVSIAADCDGTAIALTKRDKHSWRAAPCDGPLRVHYRVYAWDPSVRAAHLDDSHAFFNGTSVFLRAEGHEHAPHEVDLRPPAGRAFRDWRVMTTLPEHGAPRQGFGVYRADDYDALIDHPVEMGTMRVESFTAAGVPHEMAWTGLVPNLDAARIADDVARICTAQIAFFDVGSPEEPPRAPFDRYVFLTAVTGDGYGGLEHRASTALICSRDALPAIGPGDEPPKERSASYLTFLGLVSHEYFHSWNVKRIKPAVFAPYDLATENYTSLLWIFEGFTSYYDDLFLVRTRIASRTQYFDLVAKTVDAVQGGAGRTMQSVAESSFDAWVKYYRQDENAGNAIVSYYKKGSLVALCLDLLIRGRTRGKRSLDDVMRLMWRRFGRDFYPAGRTGVAEDAFPALVREATGVDVADEVARWAYGTEELPIAALLAPFGVALRFEATSSVPSLGARVAAASGEARIASVAHDGASHAAGLSAGDVLVAVDGLRVTCASLEPVLARHRAGSVVTVTAFRGDLLQTRWITLQAASSRAVLEIVGEGGRATRLRRDWLGADAPQARESGSPSSGVAPSRPRSVSSAIA